MATSTPKSPMIVLVRELPEERRVDLTGDFLDEALAGLAMREALDRSDRHPDGDQAFAELSIYASDDESVFVRGPLKGWFEVACSRCLGPARITLDENLAVTYLPKSRMPQVEDDSDGAAAPATDGVKAKGKRGAAASAPAAAADAGDVEMGMELAEDDLDLYGYENEHIDLTPLFRDQVILAVPFAPLCREDCKGLCPQCGADRNNEPCDCKPPVDPRWAALQNLKS